MTRIDAGAHPRPGSCSPPGLIRRAACCVRTWQCTRSHNGVEGRVVARHIREGVKRFSLLTSLSVRNDKRRPWPLRCNMSPATASLFAWLALLVGTPGVLSGQIEPVNPPPWPEQLRVRAVTTSPQGALSVDTIYYDWPGNRNIIRIQSQGNASDLYDLELGTGQEYYYTPATSSCTPMTFPVGILRPDWLANATYLDSTTVLVAGAHDCALVPVLTARCRVWKY